MLTKLLTFALFLMPITGTVQLAAPVTIHLDVISIKENRSGAEQGYLNIPPKGDRIVVTNTPMFRIIGFAFNKQRNDLIEGLPAWTIDVRWDIEATISEDSLDTFGHLPFEKQKEVLQQVLKDRCGFAAHPGKKEVPVYALTVSKSGSKLREAPPSRSDAATPGWNLKESSGKIEGRAIPIEALIYALSKAGLERQVIDRTGLKGRYDISLTWIPEEKLMSSQDTGREDDSSSASIFTAVQDELGLNLEASRAEVDAVMVTHIDHPSAN